MRPSLAVVAATPVVADTPVAEEADTLPVSVVDMPVAAAVDMPAVADTAVVVVAAANQNDSITKHAAKPKQLRRFLSRLAYAPAPQF